MERELEALLEEFTPTPSVGAAAAVIRDGQVRAVAGVGLANARMDIAFTPDTPFHACSLTKQFTCLILFQLEREGRVALDDPLSAYLSYSHSGVTIRHAMCNQSGIKDHWVAAMLCGAAAETSFGAHHLNGMLPALFELDFPPGSRFAYSNTGFALLGRLIEAVEQKRLEIVFEERIFRPLGMTASYLAQDSRRPRDSAGYEVMGSEEFIPAVADIRWSGDAGLVTTLTDMIRWERAFDKGWSELHRLTEEVMFIGGQPAVYRYGIGVTTRHGRREEIHTGALRGWRSCRLRLPDHALSVIIAFNHMADPAAAARSIVSAMLGDEDGRADDDLQPQSERRLISDDGLAATLTSTSTAAELRCGGRSWAFFNKNGNCTDTDGITSSFLRLDGAGAVLTLDGENVRVQFDDLFDDVVPSVIEGRFVCHSLKSEARITRWSDGWAIWFTGPLGRSQSYSLVSHGGGFATFQCHRSLDYAPPGEFTVQFTDQGLVISNWVARGFTFEQVGD